MKQFPIVWYLATSFTCLCIATEESKTSDNFCVWKGRNGYACHCSCKIRSIFILLLFLLTYL